jgi:hypothetical protein
MDPMRIPCGRGEVRLIANAFGIPREGVSKIAAADSTSAFAKGCAPPRPECVHNGPAPVFIEKLYTAGVTVKGGIRIYG